MGDTAVHIAARRRRGRRDVDAGRMPNRRDGSRGLLNSGDKDGAKPSTNLADRVAQPISARADQRCGGEKADDRRGELQCGRLKSNKYNTVHGEQCSGGLQAERSFELVEWRGAEFYEILLQRMQSPQEWPARLASLVAQAFCRSPGSAQSMQCRTPPAETTP